MEKTYKLKQRKEETIVFYTECPYCKRKTEGNYPTQVTHNTDVHIMNCSKNPSKIKKKDN